MTQCLLAPFAPNVGSFPKDLLFEVTRRFHRHIFYMDRSAKSNGKSNKRLQRWFSSYGDAMLIV
jgi:hypothetical protein